MLVPFHCRNKILSCLEQLFFFENGIKVDIANNCNWVLYMGVADLQRNRPGAGLKVSQSICAVQGNLYGCLTKFK